MQKKIFLILLAVAFLIEATLTYLCFFKPIMALNLFGIDYNAATSFLGFITGFFCLLVSILIVYCFLQLYNNNPGYKVLVYILSFWWIALGIGVYLVFNKTDNLLLDSLKGVALIIINYLHIKKSAATA